jgi:hypothetical protein
VIPAAGAQGEHERRGHGDGRRERSAEANIPAPRPARRERRRCQLGREPGVEPRRHAGRQRLLAEFRQRAFDLMLFHGG